MAQSFDITSAVATVTASLTTGMRSEVPFTVRNVTGRRLRVGARVRVASPAQEAWFRIAGEAERDLAVGEVAQYVVHVEVPAATPEGTARFHLQIFAVDEPSEVYTDGPTLTLAVGASAAPAPSPRRRFPWWIPVAAVLVLAVGGVTAWLLLRGPSMVQSPDVKGKTYEAAEKQLGAEKLAANRKDEVASTSDEIDKVLRQDPPAGQALRAGSEVVLFMGVAPTLPPQLVGKTFAEAEQAIASARLKAVRQDGPAKSPDELGKVIEVRPPAGQLPPGGTVTLVVGVEPTVPKSCEATSRRHEEGNAAFVEFSLPAAKDGEQKGWLNGTHTQYEFPTCRRISWANIRFTCRNGGWVASSGNYSSDALCHGNTGDDQVGLRVGVRR